MKAPGGVKALLFEKPTVNGVVSKFPLAINTMSPAAAGDGARPRIDPGTRRANAAHLEAKPPTSLKSAWKLPCRARSAACKPKRVGGAGHARRWCIDCRWPIANVATQPSRPPDPPVRGPRTADGSSPSRASTLAIPHRERNLGMYRIQVYDGQMTGMQLAGPQSRRRAMAGAIRAR